MYHSFFRIKWEQEKERGRIVSERIKREAEVRGNELMKEIYIEERAAMDGLMRKSEEKSKKIAIFCEQIE